MASTYSPDLRLELIGTGDQAGIWGNTTNTNLGTLLENAIAGYTSVAIAASPQALTAYDGAEDQARYAMLAFTTSTGANFTVCIPPNSKAYTFYNASSYTATISNSTTKNGITLSGGTTVAIPAGKTISVWSDGTNVSQQSDHLISPTMSSPAMSGTPTAPTASYGTSTTQVATTAFVQAAIQAVYPVGSIYIGTTSTSPATLFGFGTWVAYGAGRTLIGVGGGYSAGATGGSADATLVSHTHTATSSFTGSALSGHTHSITDPGHAHTQRYGQGGGGSVNPTWSVTAGGNNVQDGNYNVGTSTTGITGTESTSAGTPAGSVSTSNSTEGSSATGANLPPYIVTYMWQRTV